MTTNEDTIRESLRLLDYEPERIEGFIDGFTHELAEALKEQGPPPNSYGSSVRFGYLAAVQRLDRTGLNDIFSKEIHGV